MTQIKLILVVWLIVLLAVASIAAKDKLQVPGSRLGEQEESRVTHLAEQDRVSLDAAREQAPDSFRFREGAKITDELGEFQVTADQIHFYMQDDKRALRVLQNLSLERVARTLEDDPTPRVWSVSGTLTEFRGENFLLITRAVLKPRQLPATRAPESKTQSASEPTSESKPAAAVH